ncbi:hypothetical protein HMPREF9123_1513 [Neisseria bacilliformis ATCC BAA-1200]|uniref:Uncharacterized protein n=1 Tax=Neisseria bacilliformis ATCC BAA-1200 TaxID=888742 RepID=F2BCM5_9NEIS|nr:hypothetical protein HMPREF9123_1513 [Neisseria bacilliformis ATCC BAA-1200]
MASTKSKRGFGAAESKNAVIKPKNAVIPAQAGILSGIRQLFVYS